MALSLSLSAKKNTQEIGVLKRSQRRKLSIFRVGDDPVGMAVSCVLSGPVMDMNLIKLTLKVRVLLGVRVFFNTQGCTLKRAESKF